MRIIRLYPLMLFMLLSCRKEWLETKPDKSLVVPTTLEDLQGLLDNTSYVFNQGVPALGQISCDDYYVSFENWQSLYSNIERNAYTWATDLYEGNAVTDWMMPYQQIFYANYVLENIGNIIPGATTMAAWNNVKGTALFCRGFAFYNLATIFAKPYAAATATTDLGIPLRLTADINATSVRASVETTYQQIIEDMQAAAALLPAEPLFKTRPSKPAAYAVLARAYIDRKDYTNALLYADSALQLQHTLIDYNSIDITAAYPFPYFNTEVIYHTVFNYPQIIADYTCYVDSGLFRSYAPNDLRRYVLIDTSSGLPRFKGGYDGYTVFAGLATDELYLLRAEANARLGNTAAALDNLNTLLVKRYKAGTYTELGSMDETALLPFIISERRKELLFRGLRWNDLRRLNKDPRFAITLTRDLNGTVHTLPPQDQKYVMPIPQQEIETSGIEQNPR
jgi:starch-binding outer membrane protein, SusD/RagB family